MDQTVCSLGIVFQPIKIKQIVFIRKKTGLPVVSTLDEMEGNTGYNDSGSSWNNALDTSTRNVSFFREGDVFLFVRIGRAGQITE